MKKILYPDKAVWKEMLRRPTLNMAALSEKVGVILKNVETNGDKAVIEYEEQFDHVKLESLTVTPEEMKEAETQVPIDNASALDSI